LRSDRAIVIWSSFRELLTTSRVLRTGQLCFAPSCVSGNCILSAVLIELIRARPPSESVATVRHPKLAVIYRITSIEPDNRLGRPFTRETTGSNIAERQGQRCVPPMPSSLLCFMPIADKVIQGQDGLGGRLMRLSNALPIFSSCPAFDEGRTHPVNSVSDQLLKYYLSSRANQASAAGGCDGQDEVEGMRREEHRK